MCAVQQLSAWSKPLLLLCHRQLHIVSATQHADTSRRKMPPLHLRALLTQQLYLRCVFLHLQAIFERTTFTTRTTSWSTKGDKEPLSSVGPPMWRAIPQPADTIRQAHPNGYSDNFFTEFAVLPYRSKFADL
eukprot:5838946-Amphidinium_carterae.1